MTDSLTDSPFTLWVDADACPREAKELVYRAAERLSIRTILVANTQLTLPRLAHVSSVRVGAGLNVADDYIEKNAQKGDVAITADVPLAASLVRKGVSVFDPRGDEFTPDNAEERLAMRDLLQDLRDSGVQTKGPKPFDQRAKQQFANTLDRVLTQAKRRATP